MSDPHITVLMATCNGARFLPAQLHSLIAQTHKNWSLIVSDDGSRDATLDILHRFDRAHPGRILHLTEGPRAGSPAQNFMALLTRQNLPKGMVALADQDDVWLPQKLARAVKYLAGQPQTLPCIYASKSILTDENLVPLHQAKTKIVQPSFRNALVQNIFAGHATVLNAAALALVQNVGAPEYIAFHDWWLYQLVAGAGGACLLDPAQTVLYRQHSGNAFGASQGLFAGVKRVKHLLRNDYGKWLAAHWRALNDAAAYLTPDARDTVRDLVSLPQNEPRATQFRRLQLQRSSATGTASLWLAARLGCV